MVSGNDLNTFFITNGSVISGVSEICSILGFIGSIILGIVSYFIKKKADNTEKRVKECEIIINNLKADNVQFAETVNNLKAENAQFARIINNYGLSLADTKVVAADVFDEKAKYKPDIYSGEQEPKELSKDMFWPDGI